MLSLAGLYQKMGYLREAIRAYLHAVELESNSFDSQLNLSKHLQMQLVGQAIELLRSGGENQSGQCVCVFQPGVAYDIQGKYF